MARRLRSALGSPAALPGLRRCEGGSPWPSRTRPSPVDPSAQVACCRLCGSHMRRVMGGRTPRQSARSDRSASVVRALGPMTSSRSCTRLERRSLGEGAHLHVKRTSQLASTRGKVRRALFPDIHYGHIVTRVHTWFSPSIPHQENPSVQPFNVGKRKPLGLQSE